MAKTGTEILQDFIKALDNNPGWDADVVSVIQTLCKEGRLTDKAISNELENLRKQKLNENP